MLFNSFHFLVFFPVVLLFYFSLPQKWKNIFLLVASCYFYMAWKAEYIVIMAVEAVINYYAAIAIEKTEKPAQRKSLLAMALIVNFGFLFVFKYFNFFNDSVRAFLDYFNIMYNYPQFKLLLPIGISFFTFQITSYTVDVYRKKVPAEKRFVILALFKMFFPQLVAGPIERANNLIPQFDQEHKFEYVRVTDGLKLMLWGFFKKLVIADRLAVLVNTVYTNPHGYDGISLVIATVFFAFQIYCDFSGYSDIAIGAAQIMGFKLMDNFNRPYFSKSISEFWKRWHISLSSWFKEYLYISLGGNRVSKSRMYFNLFFTFLVSGLWHGANWTYVIWGALNGFYLIFSIWTEDIRNMAEKAVGLAKFPQVHKLYKVFITFSLTCFAWIFFRANNINDAFYIITHMFSGADNGYITRIFTSGSVNTLLGNLYDFKLYIERLGLTKNEFIIAVLSIIFMEFVHLIQRHGEIRHLLSKKPIWVRWLVYLTLLISITNLSMGQKVPFIYFQF